MDVKDVLQFIDDEMAKSQNCLDAVERDKSWINQGSYAKKAMRSLHNTVAALVTLVKGAVNAEQENPKS